MREFNLEELRQKSLAVRENILMMSAKGGAFTGASLSCSDIILYLYNNYIDLKERLTTNERDFFFLSKGHAVPALYGTFAETGILEKIRLENHLQSNDDIYLHPNVKVDGVEFHSGSLGHGVPVAVGVALDMKLSGSDKKVFVMTGDGELNEGTNWEAMLIASAKKLDNLVLIIDRNRFQANQETENLTPLEPLADKLESFGFAVRSIDGHNFDEIHNAFSQFPYSDGKPNAVISNSVRGKGIPSIENKWNKWFCSFDEARHEELLSELRNNFE